MVENVDLVFWGLVKHRLPKDVPKEYFHHLKPATGDDRAKFARWFQPIVAVKDVPASGEKKRYQMCHVSMQSTSSANFSSVNSLNSVSFFTVEKKKRQGG